MKSFLFALIIFINLSANAASIPLWIGKWIQPSLTSSSQPTIVEMIWLNENQIELQQIQWQENEFVFRAKPQVLNLQEDKVWHQNKVIGQWTQNEFYIETQDRGVKYFLRIAANDNGAFFEHLIVFSKTQTRSHQVDLVRSSITDN